MDKISAISKIRDKNKIETLCPYCGYRSEAVVFETEASLSIYSIPVKKFHNHYVAVCMKCKHSFEVEIN